PIHRDLHPFPTRRSSDLAGGLTNTGTVLASAGRIDGAIANNAGLLAVSGNVASDGTLANAAGATLAVTAGGRYSLAGPLANAGIDRKSTRLNSSHEWISY